MVEKRGMGRAEMRIKRRETVGNTGHIDELWKRKRDEGERVEEEKVFKTNKLIVRSLK